MLQTTNEQLESWEKGRTEIWGQKYLSRVPQTHIFLSQSFCPIRIRHFIHCANRQTLFLLRHAQFGQFLRDVFAVTVGFHRLIDRFDDAVFVDVKSPAFGKLAAFVDDAVGPGHFLTRIAEDGIIEIQ